VLCGKGAGMTAIKPIETNYAGFSFRSRTEARWAVFMDAMDVAYQYEPEGFKTSAGWYLPDFYIPSLDCFLEIKNIPQPLNECDKAAALVKLVGRPVYLFNGPPKAPGDNNWYVSQGGWALKLDLQHLESSVFSDEHYLWCECESCGAVGIEFDGRSNRISCGCKFRGHHEDKGYNYDSPRLLAAYTAAKRERFES
jgi:hypothetical protein